MPGNALTGRACDCPKFRSRNSYARFSNRSKMSIECTTSVFCSRSSTSMALQAVNAATRVNNSASRLPSSADTRGSLAADRNNTLRLSQRARTELALSEFQQAQREALAREAARRFPEVARFNALRLSGRARAEAALRELQASQQNSRTVADQLRTQARDRFSQAAARAQTRRA